MTPELTKLTINSTRLIIETTNEQMLQLNIAQIGQQLLQNTIVRVNDMITIIGTKVQIAITSGCEFYNSSDGPFLYASILPTTGTFFSMSFTFSNVPLGSIPHQKSVHDLLHNYSKN